MTLIYNILGNFIPDFPTLLEFFVESESTLT